MLTDIFLDNQVNAVPVTHLCGVLSDVCVPLAGRCIARLQMGQGIASNSDDLMIEFELCIGLIFKPLRHQLKNVIAADANLSAIWKSVLSVIEKLLSKRPTDLPEGDNQSVVPESLLQTMDSLASEHFQSAIAVLMSAGVLLADSGVAGDISSITWETARRMGISDTALNEWRVSAMEQKVTE